MLMVEEKWLAAAETPCVFRISSGRMLIAPPLGRLLRVLYVCVLRLADGKKLGLVAPSSKHRRFIWAVGAMLLPLVHAAFVP